MTGGFFLAELNLETNSIQARRSSGPNPSTLLIGFGGYRMYIDRFNHSAHQHAKSGFFSQAWASLTSWIADDPDYDSKTGGQAMSGVGDIRFLYVHPDYRRRGVGGLILNTIYEHASKNNYNGLMATSDAVNYEAGAFLRHQHFRILDTESPKPFLERCVLPRGARVIWDRMVMPSCVDFGYVTMYCSCCCCCCYVCV